MTSYVYNPSKKVTEVLSKYLEFDHEKLKLGIWSGDLTIENVQLRQDAFYPLLNPTLSKSGDAKEPLRIKIVNGRIGFMRVRIPWRNLVWGQGDVRVELRDVNISLAMESRQETEERTKALLNKDECNEEFSDAQEDDVNEIFPPSQREEKQTQLREAERRLLQGLPLDYWLSSKTKAKEIGKNPSEKITSPTIDELSGLDAWMNRTINSFFWRFCVGLEMKIENFKLVLLQDEIEAGMVVNELNLLAGNQQDNSQRLDTRVTNQMIDDGSGNTPPTNVMYEGEFDDGEHVDKQVKSSDLALYVRKKNTNTSSRKCLYSEDYILRPIDVEFSFSFFYPFPPEHKKRKHSERRQQRRDLHSNFSSSVDDSTASGSSKRRRGKRERINAISDATTETDIISSSALEDNGNNGDVCREDYQKNYRFRTPASKVSRSGSGKGPRSAVSLHQYKRSRRSNCNKSTRSFPLVKPDDLSIAYASALKQTQQLTAQFDAHVTFGEVVVVCSSRHFEHINILLSTIARMKNGRPSKPIASVKNAQGAQGMTEMVFVQAHAEHRIGNLHITDPSNKVAKTHIPVSSEYMQQKTLSLKLGFTGSSEKSKIVKEWWRYVRGVVLWELRHRRRLRKRLNELSVNFDWSRQKYKREEYVNLYIAIRLESNNNNRIKIRNSHAHNSHEKLLGIEDILSIEQILLYRSIARALHVRGYKKMPFSLCGVFGNHGSSFYSKENSNDWNGIHNRENAQIVATSSEEINKSSEMEECGTGRASKIIASIDNRFIASHKIWSCLGEVDGIDSLEQVNHILDSNPNNVAKSDHNEGRDFLEAESAGNNTSVAMPESLPSGEVFSDQSKEYLLKQSSSIPLSHSFEFSAKKRSSIGTGTRSVTPDARYDSGPKIAVNQHNGVDVQTVLTYKTSRSNNSTFRSVTATMVDNVSAQERSVHTLKFSFSYFCKSIEFMVVEENVPHNDSNCYNTQTSSSKRSSTNFMADDVSDISMQTDEEKFFQEVSSIDSAAMKEEETNEKPFLSSTDFLFVLPKNVLLHMTLAPLRCSVLGRVGGSKNINLTIGYINATGEKKCRMLAIGTKAVSAPVPEIRLVGKDRDGFCTESLQRRISRVAPREAFSFAIVVQEGQTVLQLDVSKTHAYLEMNALKKLSAFADCGGKSYPQALLHKSAKDEARLSLLRNKTSSFLDDLNSSIRIHGCELYLFLDPEEKAEEKATLSDSESELLHGNRSAAILCIDIFEFYSGTAVDDLCQENQRTNYLATHEQEGGALRMLNLIDLKSCRSTLSSHHSVATISGIDCLLQLYSEGTYDRPKMLANPLNFEALLLRNTNTFLAEDNAKQELIACISSIDFLVSKRRLHFCTRIVSCLSFSTPNSSLPPGSCRDILPPRLKALSSSVLNSCEVSFETIRVSLINDHVEEQNLLDSHARRIIMEESITDFISVLSCLNLDFPNEDAISSAMQICIDRLVGLGLLPEDAWDCTNSALMGFTDDQSMENPDDDSFIKKSPGAEYQSTENKNGESDSVKKFEMKESAMKNAAKATMKAFSSLVDQHDLELQSFDGIIFVDLPGGLQISVLQLFYDIRLTVCIPNLLVSNTAGIHLLRVIPEDNGGTDSTSESRNSIQGFGKCSKNSGLKISSMIIQSGYKFGKGGISLFALKAGDFSVESNSRTKHIIYETEIGDVDVTFSCKIYDDAIQAMSEILKVFNLQKNSKGSEQRSERKKENHCTLSIQSRHLSLLLISDELVPFCRLKLADVYLKTRPVTKAQSIALVLFARSFSLLNSTPGDLFYPKIIGSLPGETKSFRILIKYIAYKQPWKFGPELLLEFYGLRIFLVRKFLNELVQYIASSDYGIGRLIKRYTSPPENDAKDNPKPPLLYKVNIIESSIICPRTSRSLDAASIEIEKISIFNSYHASSFEMPSETKAFNATPESTYASPSCTIPKSWTICQPESSSNIEDDMFESKNYPTVSNFSKKAVPRINIFLKRVRLFTALCKERNPSSERDNLGHLFEIRGRAAANKRVYSLRPDHIRASGRFISPLDREKYNCRWRELTTEVLSLDVMVDYAPHMRLLITDPTECRSGSISLPMLDIRFSQLCLILSIWYCNMQELPTMFPYSTAQVLGAGRSPLYRTKLPDYGTKEFVNLMSSISVMHSEVAVVFNRLCMRCTFDKSGFFEKDLESLKYFASPGTNGNDSQGLRLELQNVVLHVTNDRNGIMRIGCGASFFEIIDERRNDKFKVGFCVGERVDLRKESGPDRILNAENKVSTWANLCWGLYSDCRTLDSSLPQPFQISVFLTKSWSLINIGAESADAVLVELLPIWFILDFFASYFTDAIYGNPSFRAYEMAREAKSQLKGSSADSVPGLNIDFRLWLTRPHLCIPCDPHDPFAPSIRIVSKSGFWYRYKKIIGFASQEIVSTGLDLVFADEFLPPRQNGDGNNTRQLIEGFSFGLRLDSNDSCKHSDYSIEIPFNRDPESTCSVTSHEIVVPFVAMNSPKICTPFENHSRSLGPHVCEITCIFEVLPLASSTLLNLFTGPIDDAAIDVSQRTDDGEYADSDDKTLSTDTTFSVAASLSDMRLFTVDPVLGVHLPVAVLSISHIKMTASQLGDKMCCLEISRGESAPEDLQVAIDCHFWADYFKLGATRSWEPLLEPYKCVLLYEKSRYRGHGMSLNSDSPLHMNISGYLLLIIDELIDTFSRLIYDAFGGQPPSDDEIERITKPLVTSDRLVVENAICSNGMTFPIWHVTPKTSSGGRVSFLFRNLTGQKIRIHQQTSYSLLRSKKPFVLTYLNHGQSTSLSFDATISVIKNMSVVEVPYPGLPHSKNNKGRDGSKKHAVGVQVPGFRWLEGVTVDTFGRKFDSLIPKSQNLLSKILQDWRLQNAVKLLVEVGLDNGGRLVTIRSLFEIRNNTMHTISLVLHPDPMYDPNAINAKKHVDKKTAGPGILNNASFVKPGDYFQVPMLLLESGLVMGGNHLGCIWFRPDCQGDPDIALSLPTNADIEDNSVGFNVGFCSRPMQLAKVVNESAVIFQNGCGEDIAPDKAASGIQVSCPMKNQDREALAPFCYVIEVGRSPIVRPERQSVPEDVSQLQSVSLTNRSQKQPPDGEKKIGNKHVSHGPVAYTLSLHAPFIITNLLSETGRFELMHATRNTVLWYGDLKAGQQVPIHLVGLDAPLLLLLNLGFCRTPVGEGALVHHGADAPSSTKEHLNSLKSLVGKAVTSGTKAVTKGTKQIGKTLTAISDSPDRRGHDTANDPQGQLNRFTDRHKENVGSLGLDTGVGGNERVDGKVHTLEKNVYLPCDVADETVVVDSIGQRLILNIENVRGGGGQRRISVFCPFWIVNTTEHALRYKQEKSTAYVSGTFVDEYKDGSRPVDGSTRNHVSNNERDKSRQFQSEIKSRQKPTTNQGTIFAGTSGALATSPGTCDLPPSEIAQLIDKDIPLPKLASIAFMFNFHDDVLSIGQRRLSVQLADGKGEIQYLSDWSRGFSLDSVGFSQIVALHCKEGRALELSVVVNVAPGFLSGYTKIVRFLPRYVLVNQLSCPVRIWQDSSVFRPISENNAYARVEDQVNGNDNKKWRFRREENQMCKINQYEPLWGRTNTLEQRGSDQIPEETTAHRSAMYIATAGSSDFVPFHLPDSRGERQLRIDLGGIWNLTSSFASDFPGDHSLKVSRAVDLKNIRHITTRASPQYKVVLPPSQYSGVTNWDGELGVWFETDWGRDKNIIVKGTKRGNYSFNETDIRAGDQLLRIDGESVSKMTFSEAMKLLRQRLTQVSAVHQGVATPKRARRISLVGWTQQPNKIEPKNDRLVLIFRTFEERLRRVRLKIAKKNGKNASFRQDTRNDSAFNSFAGHGHIENDPLKIDSHLRHVRVEMKPLHHSMFVVLREQDPENHPFRIENRSIDHVVFFRQRGCDGHPWNHLLPGHSEPYSWEEPMKSKKLTVRVATYSLFRFPSMRSNSISYDDAGQIMTSHELEHQAAHVSRFKQLFSYQFVDNEENGGFGSSTAVKLEEIGSCVYLPCPYAVSGVLQDDRWLKVQVDTDGGTRILVVSDDADKNDKVMMGHHLDTFARQIASEEHRVIHLSSLKYLVMDPSKTESPGSLGTWEQQFPDYSEQLKKAVGDERFYIVEDIAKNIVDDFPEESMLKSRHQVIVEVLEAVGLNPDSEIVMCNPYCEVVIKGRPLLKKSFSKNRRHVRKTYYLKRSLTPKWTDQSFVFSVPRDAVSCTRGHDIHVRVRNFRSVGHHPILGEAAVNLYNVRNQQELIGWYPLVGRTRKRELDNPFSHWSRGSVKLRVHWVYSVPALVDYFILMSERRLFKLQESVQGMKNQLQHAAASDKKKKDKIDPIHPAIGQDTLFEQKAKGVYNGIPTLMKETNSTNTLTSSNVYTPMLNPDKRRWVSYFQALSGNNTRENDQDLTNLQISSKNFNSRRVEQSVPQQSDLSSTPNDSILSFQEGLKHDEHGERSEYSHAFLENTANIDESAKGSTSRIRLNSCDRLNGKSLSRIRLNSSERVTSRRVSGTKRSFAFAENFFCNNLEDKSTLSFITENPIRLTNLLFKRGLIAHKVGNYFHQDYFGQKIYSSKVNPCVRSFSIWQDAQAILNDDDLNITIDKLNFQVQLIETLPSSKEKSQYKDSMSKRIAREKLELPRCAPIAMAARALLQAERIAEWRNQFERASRRALRSVLNPGGWLTIRPITALNLTDIYVGMYVKLRYGSDVLVSATVDAKVTPTWTPEEVTNGAKVIQPDSDKIPDACSWKNTETIEDLNIDNFQFHENDLHVHVEPQKTSGSIRLSVVGERLNSKTELGVLHIPLGAAIASCIDSTEDFLDTFHEGDSSATPMYVRWFPLMSPKDTVPVEGDMGLSARPLETEKLGDSMFREYFTPCIQLALMWWPDDQGDMDDASQEELFNDGDTPGKDEKKLTNQYFNADIGRISASLIDSERAIELLSFSAIDIDVRYSVSKSKTCVGLVVGWIQLDHQDGRTREKVVLAPTPQQHIQPTIQLLIVKDNFRSKKNIASYKKICLTIEELDLTVEKDWLFDLWEFFTSVGRRRKEKEKANRNSEVDKKAEDLLTTKNHFTAESSDLEGLDLLSSLIGENESFSSDGKVYIEQLVLGLVKINLSYLKGKKQRWELTEKGSWVLKNSVDAVLNHALHLDGTKDAAKSSEPSEIFLMWSQHTYDQDLWAESKGKRSQNLKGIIGAVMLNFSDASIRLQGKVLDNVFESPKEVLLSISKFYNQETLRQIYKIITSLDIVSIPTKLFSSFVSGVRDFVVTPNVALATNPTSVGIGVAKGTLSLTSHITSGILAVLAKTTAMMGQGAATLSLDAEYREWHREKVFEARDLDREYKRRGVKSVSEMITRPIGDVALGVFMGGIGLVVKPYKGLKKNGTLGFAKGIAIGIVGVGAKPIVGLLDAFAHCTASVHDLAKSVNILERRYQPALRLRLPYCFSLMNVLNPFDAVEARSVYMLKLYTSGNTRRKTFHNAGSLTETLIASEVFSMEAGIDTYAIVTTRRVVLIKVKKDNSGILVPSLCWEVGLTVDVISSKVSDHGHNGVALTITKRANTRSKSDEKHFLFNDSKKSTKSMAQDNVPPDIIDPLPIENSFESDGQITGSGTKQMPMDHVEETMVYGDATISGKRDDNSESFTVLAEYHNRRQLTRLHNAVCCVTGNFDNIVVEPRFNKAEDIDACTTFGQFQFEKDRVHKRVSENEDFDLILSLESVPWIPRIMFDNCRGKSLAEQTIQFWSIRNEWVFSNELEASIREGGQAWEIEARANSMFVPTGAPLLPFPLRVDESMTNKIIQEQKYGNISYNQVNKLLKRRAEEMKLPTRVLSHDKLKSRIALGSDSLANEKSLNSKQSNQTNLQESMSCHLDTDVATKPRLQRNIPGDDRMKDFTVNLSIDKKCLEGEENCDEILKEISISRKEKELNEDLKVSSQNFQDCRPINSLAVIHQSSSDLNSQNLSQPISESRLDRIETVMEQLTILNSNLVMSNANSNQKLDNISSSLVPAEKSLLSQGIYTLAEEMKTFRMQLANRSRKEEDSVQLIKSIQGEIRSLKCQLLDKKEKR